MSLDDVFLFGTATPANANWYSFSFDYTATSSSALLNLSQINGVYYDIDNITMQVVPEPSANSLILLGIGVLIYVRKRHKKHSAHTHSH